MADDRIQKLYDDAFQKWRDKDMAEATRLIDEALALSPNDLALNALAFHIKRTSPFSSDMVVHAERILDIDVHYRDVIDGTEEGRDFTRSLMHYYPLLIMHAEDGELPPPLTGDIGKEGKKAATRRMCTYGMKLLVAGYGIPNLYNFLDALSSLEKYDVVINIGQCQAGLKTSAEIGLPGLDHCADDSNLFESIEGQIAAAFANAMRDREALEWCQSLIAKHPDDWYNYGILGENLMDEVCAHIRTSQPAMGTPLIVGRDHLMHMGGSSSAKGLPTRGFANEVRHELGQHIVGHEPILDRLAALAVDEKLGIRISKRPRVLYFLGKPDTGKRASARALSAVLWPKNKERFLRINMGLLSDPANLNRLIGVPSGYVGSDNGGMLAMHLKQYPFSIIYLQNFHEADEKVQRFFINTFLDGSFPDADGRTIFAGSALFILSATLKDDRRPVGFSPAQSGHVALAAFLEREGVLKAIGEVTEEAFWFDPLEAAKLKELVSMRLRTIANQPGVRDFGICFDEAFVEEIVKSYTAPPTSTRDLETLLMERAYPFIPKWVCDKERVDARQPAVFK